MDRTAGQGATIQQIQFSYARFSPSLSQYLSWTDVTDPHRTELPSIFPLTAAMVFTSPHAGLLSACQCAHPTVSACPSVSAPLCSRGSDGPSLPSFHHPPHLSPPRVTRARLSLGHCLTPRCTVDRKLLCKLFFFRFFPLMLW